jgi:hypothetical protein
VMDGLQLAAAISASPAAAFFVLAGKLHRPCSSLLVLHPQINCICFLSCSKFFSDLRGNDGYDCIWWRERRSGKCVSDSTECPEGDPFLQVSLPHHLTHSLSCSVDRSLAYSPTHPCSSLSLSLSLSLPLSLDRVTTASRPRHDRMHPYIQ